MTVLHTPSLSVLWSLVRLLCAMSIDVFLCHAREHTDLCGTTTFADHLRSDLTQEGISVIMDEDFKGSNPTWDVPVPTTRQPSMQPLQLWESTVTSQLIVECMRSCWKLTGSCCCPARAAGPGVENELELLRARVRVSEPLRGVTGVGETGRNGC